MRSVLAVTVAAAVLALTVPAGCGGGSERSRHPVAGTSGTIPVRSGAFAAGTTIPRRYTCDGDRVPPPLTWGAVPTGTRALAVVVDDPDAPGGTYTHWIVVDLPPDARALGATPPAGSHQATNSAGTAGWSPPCPPRGDAPHRYRFTVYALDARTGLPDGAGRDDARAAIDRHTLATGRLVGRFGH